ncbi:hypothetical protein [Methanolobus sp.]|nr:hypothetical protein [Methanolobus sp.]
MRRRTNHHALRRLSLCESEMFPNIPQLIHSRCGSFSPTTRNTY